MNGRICGVLKRCWISAATAGASLVVFPETVDYIGTEMREHAKTVPGQWDQFFPRKSKDYGIYIHGVASRREMIAGIRIIQA